MDCFWSYVLGEKVSFLLPRLLSVIVITACEREVGDDTLDGDAAFAEEIVLIITFMPRETFVNDVLDM